MNVEIVVLKCQKYNECFNVQCSTLSAIVIVIAKNRHIYIYMCVVVAMLPCLVEGQLKKVSQRFFLLACGIHTMGPRQAF